MPKRRRASSSSLVFQASQWEEGKFLKLKTIGKEGKGRREKES